jgi:hypothetical protein
MPADHGPFRFVAADGCRLNMLEDDAFDIAHSNSVVEHAGNPERMAPFFHWLPRSMRICLIRHFDLRTRTRRQTRREVLWAVESSRLLDRRTLQELLGEAEIFTAPYLGPPKSLIAV